MTTPHLAIVVYEPGSAADRQLAVAVSDCRSRGVKVTGLVQHNDGECALPGFGMALEDVASRRRFAITQPGARKDQGCVLDMGGLAEAAMMLEIGRHRDSDLVVVNKFGRQEILGRGLRNEMAALVAEGIPVLTSVRRDFLAGFGSFAGDAWTEVKPEADAVMGWLAGLRHPAHVE